MIMLWLRPSTASTKLRSSNMKGHGVERRTAKWRLSIGCIGTTKSAYLGLSVTSHQQRQKGTSKIQNYAGKIAAAE
jgi:hypothetical protein